MKILFSLLLAFHGLIHMMGCVKAFELGNLPQLTQTISRPVGVVWLVAALLFILTAAARLLGQTNWWMLALPALLLSQSLILLSWRDARWGSVVNLVVLLVTLVACADWRFVRRVKLEQEALLAGQPPVAELVRREQLTALPAVVQKWLLRAGVVGRPVVETVSLHQRGRMRTQPQGIWLDMEADQVFRITEPAFNWLAHVQMLQIIPLTARDQYRDGQGEMLIKAFALFPVADARGPTLNQGAMLRYVAETVWFPSAALAPYLSWEGLDDTRARATMTYGGIRAEATFHFTPEGDFSYLEAMRYYDRPTGATLEPWLIKARGYRSFAGMRIPADCQVIWRLKEGDFNWLELEITDISYNSASGDL